MKNVISIIDTFTSKEFSGNPAAVYHMYEDKSTEWMQSFAAEINLSETAFLKKINNTWNLRWFTSNSEVDLCGHATLASAHYLWNEKIVKKNEVIKFDTRSGILKCRRDNKYIYMYFPLIQSEQINYIKGFGECLGCKPDYIRKNKWDIIAIYNNYSQILKLNPNFESLKKFSSRGVIITSPGFNGFNFASRFFAPNIRIDEDYVTGSIYCCLGPYWSKRLNLTHMTAYQASRRPGVIDLKVYDDKVRIGGQAKTITLGKSI